MLATTALAVVLAGPLAEVPRGWMHVRRCTYDRVAGAYYEASSGAYVQYSISSRWPRQDRKDWKPAGSLHDGTPVVQRQTEDAVALRRAEVEEIVGLPFAEIRSQGIATVPMPPAGSRQLELEFARDRAVWYFSAVHCDPLQRERVKALLLDPKARFAIPSDPDGNRGCAEPATQQAFEALAGKTLDEALAVLGTPSGSWPHECGGIAVEWPMVLNGSKRGWSAVFARDGDGGQRQWIEGPHGALAE
jgi:hypothetical protein